MVGRRVAYRKTASEHVRKLRPLILTVGHSTRERKEFIELLRAHGVEQLVDVRTIPRSRHNPQFNRVTLSHALRKAGIAYLHLDGLGGLRHSRRDSINTGWRNKSFRGYADYMQTPDFRAALRTLVRLAGRKRVALMCAEAVPWRCHRSLIADALVVRGFPVEEIQSTARTRPHGLTSWARVQGIGITYPPPAWNVCSAVEELDGRAKTTTFGDSSTKEKSAAGNRIHHELKGSVLF